MMMRILLVDDHEIFREGLRALLNSQDNITVIGEASNGRKAVEMSMELKPDLVIMDMSMPLLNGIEASRQIISTCPGTKVLMLSMFSDRRFVTSALDAGVNGYILKDCKFTEFLEAIHAIQKRETYLCSRVTKDVLTHYKAPTKESSTQEGCQKNIRETLSPRECEITQLMAEGFSTREIADQLNISIKTVNTHREHIMNKLNITNLADLIKYAIREGIANLEN